jgi:regulator of protease activity HflC (stomatin/prohibitin superfamily)
MDNLLTLLIIIIVVIILKTIVITPEKYAFILERFGKFNRTLDAGYHFAIPFVDVVRYKHTLKELAYDVPPQECITKDNVPVEVDGILYLKVIDPYRASYGIDNYLLATTQLAKTTLRAEIGKLNLDATFSERESINSKVVTQIDNATDPWGLKVTRYEIKNISPPKQVLNSMEQQMRAEREKRAEITISEGERASRINRSIGEKQEAINISEGEKIKRINEANGKAAEIEFISQATANGLKWIGAAISKDGGKDAVDLQIAQGYLDGLGKIFSTSKTTVLPPNLAGIAGVFEGLSKVTNKIPSIQSTSNRGDKK